MRIIIIDRDTRPRPVVLTPAKGSAGDMVDESQAAGCAIDAIIKRYGGQLPAVARWRDGDVQLPLNREDVATMAYNACRDLVESGKTPWSTVDDALKALADGTLSDAILTHLSNNTPKPDNDPEKKEVTNEA